MSARGERLPLSTMLIFAAPTLGTAFMVLFIGFYLMKFSTDVLGIAPQVMGLIFLASRVWDAISDPFAGYFSDRTRTRIGRRRPWLLAGAIPVGVVFTLMWGPPASLGPTGLSLWMGAGVISFYTAMTVYMMPHDALGAELSTNYHERNRLFGIRRVCIGVGALPVFAAMAVLTTSDAPRDVASTMGIAGAIVTSSLMLMTGIFIRERASYQGRGSTRPLGALLDVARNPHGRRLLFVYFLQQLAVGLIVFTTAYFAHYILGSPEAVTPMLGTFFIVSIVCVPGWIALGQRFEKKSLVIVSMCTVALALASIGFTGPGDVVVATLVAGTAGAAGGGLDVLFPSIQADVIDFDEHRSGERKEGIYFAAWNFASKTATGLAAATAGFVLAASGFEPNVEQSESAKWAIRGLMSGIPFLCYCAGLLVFLRFGLSRSAHATIRDELDARV